MKISATSMCKEKIYQAAAHTRQFVSYWYLLHMRAADAKTNLCIYAGSSEHLLLAHTKSMDKDEDSDQPFMPLALLNSFASVFEEKLTSFFTCLIGTKNWVRSGSVVECLTRDRGAAGSSLTGVTALWYLQDIIILA